MPNMSVGSFNFDDAPGGDLSIDDLFGDGHNQDGQQQIENPQSQQQVDPVAPTEPFLKTATGTVYNTVEDAIKGTEHKDDLIVQLRQKLEQATGNDPLKRTQETTNSNQPMSPADRARKFYADLDAAIKSGDESRVYEVQQQQVYETIAPYLPTLANLSKSQAVSAVASEIPDFTKFVQSDDYTKTLDNFPMLKESIQIGESNPQAAERLPELYKMVYQINMGRNLPRIVEENQRQTTAPVRPTVSSTPMAPNTTQVQAPRTAQERYKAVIDQMESSGIGDRRF